MKGLSILGSTGSVGVQTLDVIRTYPDKFDVIGLAANSNHEALAAQVREFSPAVVSCNSYPPMFQKSLPSTTTLCSMNDMAVANDVDILITATTGYASLIPTFEAIEHGKSIAIANKESVIMAGQSLIDHANKHKASLHPIDSEPSAVWQCIRGEESAIHKIIITASGGPFRNTPLKDMGKVSPSNALRHPTWSMGAKISVDSATMMNKAFEVIEAKWLFGVKWDQIDVTIHPESIVHSIVEFQDGSSKSQMSYPDMRLPIQHALLYPKRPLNPTVKRFDPSVAGNLTFQNLEPERYPCFNMALNFAKRGGTWPSVLCGADEGAVEAFLSGKISFTEIPQVIKSALNSYESEEDPSLIQLVKAFEWGLSKVKDISGMEV